MEAWASLGKCISEVGLAGQGRWKLWLVLNGLAFALALASARTIRLWALAWRRIFCISFHLLPLEYFLAFIKHLLSFPFLLVAFAALDPDVGPEGPCDNCGPVALKGP